MRLNPTTKNMLSAAIEEDHPCDDRGCDIAVAAMHGFTLAAAHLLMGATETPAVDAVVKRWDLDIPDVHSHAFDQWVSFHRKYGRQCPDCEGYMYDYPPMYSDRPNPTRCSNCYATMPEREDS